jgi:hypothetical protein
MDSKKFFDLVSHMRDRQKEYFRSRNASSLKESKRLEREVDKEIDRVNKIISERNQTKLF